jgi:hypothetical protein
VLPKKSLKRIIEESIIARILFSRSIVASAWLIESLKHQAAPASASTREFLYCRSVNIGNVFHFLGLIQVDDLAISKHWPITERTGPFALCQPSGNTFRMKCVPAWKRHNTHIRLHPRHANVTLGRARIAC